jgi:hypothetical protein
VCSYNSVNGVPTCADEWLLTTVARGEWGFDGYIVSDCGATKDVYARHHYTSTPQAAVNATLSAGMDMDCGTFLVQHTRSALEAGTVSEAQIDAALRRTLKVRLRLAHFDPPGLESNAADDTVCSTYARRLARDGAAQSTVLLKNDDLTTTHRRLPLARGGILALVGPNVNLSMTLAGYYGPAYAWGPRRWPTLVDACTEYAARVAVAAGVPSVTSNDTSHIPEALALARTSDAVVCVLGTDLSVAREGVDATSLALSDAQLELAARLADAAPSPIVVVLLTATPLDLSPLLSNPKVGAIVCWAKAPIAATHARTSRLPYTCRAYARDTPAAHKAPPACSPRSSTLRCATFAACVGSFTQASHQFKLRALAMSSSVRPRLPPASFRPSTPHPLLTTSPSLTTPCGLDRQHGRGQIASARMRIPSPLPIVRTAPTLAARIGSTLVLPSYRLGLG